MSSTKEIVSEIASRDAFIRLLEHNTGLVVIKFGAKWCGPCRTIEHDVHDFFLKSPNTVICCDIDIDVCYDVYSYLKSKKMVNGIPVLLCYKKGNRTFIPDLSVTGSSKPELYDFFRKCGNLLNATLRENPNKPDK